MSKWAPIDGALLRLIVQESVGIREALGKSVNVEEVAHQWTVSHPEGSKATGQEAREWAKMNVQPKTQDVQAAVLNAIAHGAGLGKDAAQHILAMQIARKTVGPKITTDWSNWTPGNHPAANLVRPKGGMAKLLSRTDTTIKEISRTTLDRIGTKLADGLKAGYSDAKIAESLKGVINDPVRALSISHTEMNRAFNVQSIDTYTDWGVEKIEWETSDPCDDCAENDGEVVTIGDAFPSGDEEPPVHPNCNCRVVAYVEFGNDPSPFENMDPEDFAPEVSEAASEVYSMAALAEPEATSLLGGLVRDQIDAGNDVRLVGLEHRLKTKESLARKLEERAKDLGSMAEAKTTISDAVRYTMLVKPSKYSDTISDVVAKMEAKGFQARGKNYWLPDSPYKGVNVALTSPSGQVMELQFHTPQSLRVKDHANHVLYERARVISPKSKEWKDLQAQMRRNSAAIAHPKGIDRLFKMVAGIIRKALTWAA
jgi:hypothetical protein